MGMDIWHLVGSNVAARRQACGWSQETLADKSGFSQQYLSGLEKGRRNPTLKTMAELAHALGIEVVDLFGEVPPGGIRPSRKPPVKSPTRS